MMRNHAGKKTKKKKKAKKKNHGLKDVSKKPSVETKGK